MLIESASVAGGDIEIMFLRQRGDDPFISTPERTAQIGEVAGRIARFISEARSTLDIAIYDFRLHDEAAAIITNALRERATNNVVIRIIYDATTEPEGDIVPTASPAHLEADKKVPGTETFVRSFAEIAQIKGITGYRVLMHSKYLVRDNNTDDAAVFLGSANYTNDSWGLQENNLLQLRSRPLAAYFSKNFTDLLAAGRIAVLSKSNESEKLRRTSIKSGYIFCTREIATVLKLDLWLG